MYLKAEHNFNFKFWYCFVLKITFISHFHVEHSEPQRSRSNHTHNSLLKLQMTEQGCENQVCVPLSFYLVIFLMHESQDSNLQQTVRMFCDWAEYKTNSYIQQEGKNKQKNKPTKKTHLPGTDICGIQMNFHGLHDQAWELLSTLLNSLLPPFHLPPLSQVDVGWLDWLQ